MIQTKHWVQNYFVLKSIGICNKEPMDPEGNFHHEKFQAHTFPSSCLYHFIRRMFGHEQIGSFSE